MIDMQKEKVYSLSQSAKIVPSLDGKPIHTSTLWRWCKKGLKGVRLEYIRIGTRICTSKEALSRFFVALAEKEEFS